MTARRGRTAPVALAGAPPERGPVLVVAPHPDDELVGCGGALALHAEAGDPVHVLVVFDGAAGDPDGRFARAGYVARRRAEALEGGARVGVGGYSFWGLPEGHEPPLELVRAAAERVAALVERLAPATVYAPWRGDGHVDHASASRAARLALELAGFAGAAWGYEVWSPLVPTRLVDVGPTFERKRAALRAHATQLTYRDLAHAATGLAAWRSLHVDGARFVEAFAALGPADAADRGGRARADDDADEEARRCA